MIVVGEKQANQKLTPDGSGTRSVHEGGKGPGQGRGGEEQATEGRVARTAAGEPVSGGCSQRQRQWKVGEDRAGWRVGGGELSPRGEERHPRPRV